MTTPPADEPLNFVSIQCNRDGVRYVVAPASRRRFCAVRRLEKSPARRPRHGNPCLVTISLLDAAETRGVTKGRGRGRLPAQFQQLPACESRETDLPDPRSELQEIPRQKSELPALPASPRRMCAPASRERPPQ